MKTILLGPESLIGKSFLKLAKKRGHIVSSIVEESEIYKPLKNLPNNEHNDIFKTEIQNHQKIQEYLFKVWPDAIINCIESLEDEKLMEQKNVLFPKFLSQLTNHLGIKLIHISTNEIFNGNSPKPYRATDKPDPLNYYGQTKLLGEKQILQNSISKPIILRLPKLLAKEQEIIKTTYNNSIINNLKITKKLTYSKKLYFEPTTTSNVAEVLIELLERNDLSGIYHWSGEESINEYDLGLKILEKNKSPLLNELPVQFPYKKSDNLNFYMDIFPLKSKLKTKPLNLDKIFKELDFKEPLDII